MATMQRTSETAKDFKVFYKKVPTGSSYTMDHSAFSYVFDPKGKIRLVLRHEQSAEECAQDLARLSRPHPPDFHRFNLRRFHP